MIDAALEVLRAKGLFSTRIRFDKFVGTDSQSVRRFETGAVLDSTERRR